MCHACACLCVCCHCACDLSVLMSVVGGVQGGVQGWHWEGRISNTELGGIEWTHIFDPP